MPAILDLYAATKQLSPRERIVGLARMYLGTPYGYGSKAARPLDGAHGVGERRTIDCSGFVRNVYDEAFPNLGLGVRDDLNVATFRVTDLFKDVTAPMIGDIVCWDSHMGIVSDRDKGLFIHAPHTGDVVKVSEYASGYWNGMPNRLFRQLKTLDF
jgi:cell wall-associated NlpC family hydrolase